MKCWPLDLRHLQRDSDFSAGFGRNGDPAYTLTSAQAGGGNIPAVAVIHDNCGKSLEVCAETAPCLTCQQDKHPWSVIHEAYPLDLRNALRDADREGRTGVGFGESGDPANTVTQGAVPAVACVDVWASTPTIDETGTPTMRRCTRLGVIERERERERKWTNRSTLCAELRPWRQSVCRAFLMDGPTLNTTAGQRRIR